ncbi:acylphosphatase [Streptomyces sp. NPDC057654]|uniref:acylphosphatase n=1 Tax=Streptomyces sp. NPDC057654 TaxID=3346196 RepID=UPI0036C11268
MIRRHVHVRGLVQGVYYRDTCRRLADETGVNGWVRNLHNGDVEAVFEGAPGDVQRLVGWASVGPGAADVAECRAVAEEPEGEREFRVLGDAPAA